jgi:hypothetical protein
MQIHSHQFKEENELKIIQDTIQEIISHDLVNRGSGFCLSMSDICYNLLRRKGIESELIECTLMVILKDPPNIHLIGYNGFLDLSNLPNKMENHVVCITKTKVPYLIDLSLSQIDPNVPYVCIPIVNSNDSMVEHDYGNSVWIYKKKIDSELPKLHQRSIIERIQKDHELTSKLNLVQTLLILFGLLTTLNFIRGSFDFYQKYVVPDNNYGPNKIIIQSDE